MAARTGVAPGKGNSSLGTPISALAHKRIMAIMVTRTRCGNMPCDMPPPSVRHTTLSLLPSAVMSPPPRRHSCLRRNDGGRSRNAGEVAGMPGSFRFQWAVAFQQWRVLMGSGKRMKKMPGCGIRFPCRKGKFNGCHFFVLC